MIRYAMAALAALALAPKAGAQNAPTPADWERLHLRVNWTGFAPIENRADSVLKMQLFGNDLFVQNASGTLFKIDAATGAYVWSFLPPLKRRAIYPVAVNETLVFFINSTNLYMIERATGKTLFETDLGSFPSAGPTADSQRVFIPLNSNKTVAYRFVELREQLVQRNIPQEASRGPQLGLGFTPFEDLATTGNTAPSVAVLATLRSPFSLPGIDAQPSLSIPIRVYPPYTLEGSHFSPSVVMVKNLTTLAKLGEIKNRLEPLKIWEKNNKFRVNYDLLNVEACGSLILPSKAGEVAVAGNAVPEVKLLFQTDSQISAGLGIHDYIVYVPTSDSYLYAYNVKESDRPIWREPTGGEITRTPLVTDDSIFIVGGSAGLRRIERKNGKLLWPSTGFARGQGYRSPGDEILAVNSKFVYTVDIKGKFYVVDRNRGINLSNIDLGNYTVFLDNDQDDRIIVATSEGRILCLQDKDFRKPMRIKKDPPKLAPPEPIIPPEPKAAPEKKEPVEPAPKKDVPPKKEMEKEKDAIEKDKQ